MRAALPAAPRRECALPGGAPPPLHPAGPSQPQTRRPFAA